MYYNRTLSNEFAAYIEPGGPLSWLFEFVKQHKELDFLIGRNNVKHGLETRMNQNEWISVYHGLTRILKIKSTSIPYAISIDGAQKYKALSNIYGKRNIGDNFQDDILNLIQLIHKDKEFNRYFNTEKEGFFQNKFSRRYGIRGNVEDDFVIIDKESVIGYESQSKKDSIFDELRSKYKQLQCEISISNPKRFGKDLENKTLGNELDFLALDKYGNILPIQFKHGTNTSGIYLSPLQIGLYHEIFNRLPLENFKSAICEMLDQKQKIGLVNPGWKKPVLSGKIIPWLIISKYNERCCAKEKFPQIMKMARHNFGQDFLKDLKVFNYTPNDEMTEILLNHNNQP